ncbi:MAG: Dyp-type peroxidase [Neisseriaceae bacterium]|nr:MAG: Dyp-type peroxidase [Neisseriaceae bacterium]
MKTYQTGIIEDKTSSAIFMLFKLTGSGKLSDTLAKLSNKIDGSSAVAGFGNKLMKFFPKVNAYQQHKFNSPLLDNESGCDVAIWLKNNDKGKLFHQATEFRNILSDSFELQNVVSAYSYREKFDLSDFEDGIENPEGDAMLPVAISEDGSSFWVLQQWLHDFNWLSNSSQHAKEMCIGRSMDDSHQFADLPPSAHVKKSAKENFEPEAELLRKSMPWSDDKLNGGLMFSSFGHSFRAFNLQMSSMLGIDDGIIDGVFKFSKIMNTNYLWCPPMSNGVLDLSLLEMGK